MDDRMLDRVVGAMVGQAIGDALGAPLEHRSEEEIDQAFPLGVTGFVQFHDLPAEPGDITDDTEMSLLVASSLVERRGLEIDDVVELLKHWGRGRSDLGPSTSQAISALAGGAPWRRAGSRSEPSSGCLPRCMPVALVFPATTVVEQTLTCCSPTHRHPLAVGSVIAQNLLITRLVEGAPWTAAVGAMRTDLETIPEGVAILEATDGGRAMPGAADVLTSAIAAVDAASGVAPALIEAVSRGGDADTRGAVAGALSGARWGATAIPRSWFAGCRGSAKAAELGARLAELRIEQEQCQLAGTQSDRTAT